MKRALRCLRTGTGLCRLYRSCGRTGFIEVVEESVLKKLWKTVAIMKCRDIINKLEKRYPKEYAVDWDNVGLLVGDEEKEVGAVFCALDLTDDTLEEALQAGADLIVTHHPMLFKPVGKIVRQDFIGRRIMALIENGISYYAMHTNFDIAGMADRNAKDLGLIEPKVLEPVMRAEMPEPVVRAEIPEPGADSRADEMEAVPPAVQGFGRVGRVAGELPLKDFAAKVKSVYGLEQIRVYGDPEKTVRIAAVSSGSGKSSLEDAIRSGADVLITGDVDYHTAIDAVTKRIAVIDAGHYGTEFCFIEEASAFLKEEFPDLKVECAQIRQPFSIF